MALTMFSGTRFTSGTKGSRIRKAQRPVAEDQSSDPNLSGLFQIKQKGQFQGVSCSQCFPRSPRDLNNPLLKRLSSVSQRRTLNTLYVQAHFSVAAGPQQSYQNVTVIFAVLPTCHVTLGEWSIISGPQWPHCNMEMLRKNPCPLTPFLHCQYGLLLGKAQTGNCMP